MPLNKTVLQCSHRNMVYLQKLLTHYEKENKVEMN